nr:MAG TPA: hypothetical protein [Caudoviricetes sp.]DAV60611.1 MAG TPA: hypothetical protein [Caudoviricetes sp.]DAW18811.1 MAG TPA: hypothetical protein [Bacteriophage sp.]
MPAGARKASRMSVRPTGQFMSGCLVSSGACVGQ